MGYETHKFFCLKCGRASIPLARKKGHQHKDWHRKKLYCPYCKMTLNHMEIKNLEQEQEFLERFREGEFINEAEESLAFSRNSWLG